MDGPSQNKSKKCGYNEQDRRLKEQFMNGINDENVMTKIIMELTAIRKTNEITNEQVLSWARRLLVQRDQTAILDVAKESKQFDAIQNMTNRIMPQT